MFEKFNKLLSKKARWDIGSPGTLPLAIAAVLAGVAGPAPATTVIWIDTTGFWDIAGNWDLGIPTSVDDAVINVNGTHTITVRNLGGPFTVNSITMTGDETLAIAGGSLTANSASTLGNFLQTAGTLQGPGNFTVTGQAAPSLGRPRPSCRVLGGRPRPEPHPQ